MADAAADRPTTVAEKVAAEKRRGNPLKKAAGLLIGLVLVLVLFGSVFVISGVFQVTSGVGGKGGQAPWSERDAPNVTPPPLDQQ